MSLPPSHQTSSTAAGAITILVLALFDSLANGQVTLIDFETIPPYPATVDSFGDLFPGITLASDNQWLADEVNNSLFENIHGRSITALSDAPLNVHFDSPKRDIGMDLGSGALGMNLTIGITGYIGGQLVFSESFVTHPVDGGADEVRAHTFGIVDTFVVRRTAGGTGLTLDNLSFATVPEPAALTLVAAVALGLVMTRGLGDRKWALARREPVAVSIALFVSASSASGAMFNANNVAELIAAIDAANQNAVPDTIALSPGTTFTLTEVNNTLHGSTGLPTIADSANLTILGNGATIERSTALETQYFRLFDVAAGASLALENLTLQGGFGWGSGGAIYNEGNLALDGVTVENSIARGSRGADCRCRPGGNGGAGKWGLGGGIYSSGSLLLENSALLSNQARGGQGGSGSPPGHSGRGGNGQGGGLYAAAGSATLYNSLVTGNTAVGGIGSPPGDGYGGGLFIVDADVTLDEFTFAHVTSNTASTNYPNIYGPYDLISNPNPLPGDYNGNGIVDAADYVVWRDGIGSTYMMADYDVWKSHFGQTAGSGAGSVPAMVPEPATAILLLIAGFVTRRLRMNRVAAFAALDDSRNLVATSGASFGLLPCQRKRAKREAPHETR